MTTDLRTEPSSPVSGEKCDKLKNLSASTLAIIGVCVALVGWLYAPVFVTWWKAWMADESYYSHGVLVPVIVGLLVWLNRERLATAKVRPYAPAYAFVIFALLLTTVAFWLSGSVIQGFMLPILIFGMVGVLFGKDFMELLRFPIGYMYFMAVLPGDILTKLTFKIQMYSVIGASGILQMLGLYRGREGVRIALPNVDLDVQSACSGFKLLIALFALATLYVYLIEGSKWRKSLLIVLMLPASVILNSLRIAMVGVVGEFWGSHVMQVFHDTAAGIIMLILAFIVLLLLARVLKCEKFNSMLSF